MSEMIPFPNARTRAQHAIDLFAAKRTALAALAEITAEMAVRMMAVTEACVDVLDAFDPDADLEPNGDEEDGTDAEDEHLSRDLNYGPGCPFADPDCDRSGWQPEEAI